MAATRPIIIIKKKGGHGGHHGGAWKVAYADFVTAMMALFIVLWLMNSSKQVQEAVGGYFKDPSGTSKKVGTDQQRLRRKLHPHQGQHAKLKEQLQKAVRDAERLRQAEESDRDDRHRGRTAHRVAGIRHGDIFRVRQPSPQRGRQGIAWPSSPRNWESCPTRFPSKATPIPSPTRAAEPTGTGSFPPTAPTPPAASCNRAVYEPTRFRKSEATPTSDCAIQRIRWIPRTGESR